jgi:hypothetical protein
VNRGDRSAQIWPLLALCAGQKLTLSYDHVGKLIGYPGRFLGQPLEPIQSYCLLHHLPALTSLVVSVYDDLPSKGFAAPPNVAAEQARVFGHDWLAVHVPSPEEFEAAVTKLPSNGRSLAALLAQVEAAERDEALTGKLRQ